MAVLVTGGLGYIGSHTCIELLNSGKDVVVIDNLYNSKIQVKDRIKQITNKEVKFYNIDIKDKDKTEIVFEENKIDSVIHFAALKAVGESVEKPLDYYTNNLTCLLNILNLMKKYSVKNFIFSSSATVYGQAKTMPIIETFERSATNPYGQTKLISENILMDIANADKSMNIAILRYFNPIGAHESGLIGEEACGIPNNLMPYITKVAVGELKKLNVFGNDYDTPDGTCIRDYIHVVDLAKGHIKALEKLATNCGLVIYNLGTGKGYSVLDIVNAFSKASNINIPYEIAPRRAGDVTECYADPSKANKELNWHTTKTLEDMCKDSWRWQKNNPKGYV